MKSYFTFAQSKFEKTAISVHPPSLGTPAYLEILAYAGLFVLITFLKSPVILKHPRFWAEEGTVFYAAFLHLLWYRSILFIKSGSVQLSTNIIVYASSKVPAVLAPAVTVYASLLFHLIVVVQLIWLIRVYELAKTVGVLLIASVALLPQTFEVWLNATNLQWIAGLSCLLLLAMPKDWINQHWKGAALWCFILGLSGVPATILTPIFLVRAAIERSPALAALSLALGMDAIVQLAILDYVGGERRPYPHDLYILVVPLFLQSVVAPLLSADLADQIGPLISTPHSIHRTLLTIVLVGGVGVMALVVGAARSGRPMAPVWSIFLTWIFVPTVQNFGALYPGPGEFSGWAGGRYFLIGSFCLCILAAWGTKARRTYMRLLCVGILTAIPATGVYAIAVSRWPQRMLHGPSWQKQVNACKQGETCQIRVWPEPWSLKLTK